jgi:hypothetical protein
MMIAHFLAASVALSSGSWSASSTWDTPPVVGSHVEIPDGVVVVVDVSPPDLSGVDVDGSLTFDPFVDVHLRSAGNVVVHGLLTMRPLAPSVEHRLTFIGVDESAFVGGGHSVLASDVGLWVMHSGTLDAAGHPRRAWSRIVGGAPSGASVIVVNDATGWQVGDVVSIAPTDPPNVPGFAVRFEERTIVDVDGNIVTLSSPLAWSHQGAVGIGAEVFNLTRNVVIEGQPTGRAHVALMEPEQPIYLSHITIQHMGPRKVQDLSVPTKILGRYSLHIHHGDDLTDGSLVEGVLVRDGMSHSFVPHASHGVTLLDTVAYNVREDGYWWDPPDEHGTHATHRQIWEHCAAALVSANVSTTDRRLAGFVLRGGDDNQIIDSVAVGIQGRDDAAGFQWPEGTSSTSAVWNFSPGNVAHNNVADGIFVWQNTGATEHTVRGFVGYYNGDAGITHGAYTNDYHYEDATLYGNGVTGVSLEATSRSVAEAITFDGLVIDGAGIGGDGIQTHRHKQITTWGFLRNVKISNVAKAWRAAWDGTSNNPDLWVVINLDVDDVPVADRWDLDAVGIRPESEIRAIDTHGNLTRLFPLTSPSTCATIPAWSAKVCEVPRFVDFAATNPLVVP